MSIRFLCPSGHRLTVADSYAGRKVRCGACKHIALVPAASALPMPGQAEPSRSSPPPLPVANGRREMPIPLFQLPPRRPPPQPPQPSARWEKLRWRHRKPRVMPADVYHPDPLRVAEARWLGLVLVAAVALSLLPTIRHMDLPTAPGWARAAIVLAVLQLIYVAWMAAAPDWSSVWIVMLVFALVATAYAVTTAIALATPLDQPMLLSLGEIRATAARWCGTITALMMAGTYLCGRTSARWYREFEFQMADRRL